jgi:membrane-associated protease RseP (regulator of RpoE activity)
MGRWWWWASAAGVLALLVAGLSMAGVFRRTADTHGSVKPPAAHEQPSRPQPADPTPSPPGEQASARPTFEDPSGLMSALQSAISAGDQPLSAVTGFDLQELAVKVMFVTDEQASTLKHLGLPAGAVVIGVGPGPALRAGLQAGDVITAIGDAPIKSADDLRQAARRVGPGKTRYGVRRNDRTLAIDIECPDCTNP